MFPEIESPTISICLTFLGGGDGPCGLGALRSGSCGGIVLETGTSGRGDHDVDSVVCWECGIVLDPVVFVVVSDSGGKDGLDGFFFFFKNEAVSAWLFLIRKSSCFNMFWFSNTDFKVLVSSSLNVSNVAKLLLKFQLPELLYAT